MDFLKEFQRRMKKIDEPKTETVAPPIKVNRQVPKSHYYSLIKIQDGKRTRVGFRLTEEEAKILANNLERKMRKLPDFDEAGGPLFEITLSEIAKED